MILTFLGTGTSQGVPVIGCSCPVCKSTDPKDNRLRTSVLIEAKDFNFTIDAGPDFRYQMLREKVSKLDAILVTHGHKDHVGGMDDIRAFNFLQKKPMTVFADQYALESIKKEFFYAFEDDKYPDVPNMNLCQVDYTPIRFKQLEIIPIPVMHAQLPVTGYRINDLSYITDANYISPESMSLLKGTEILIINALRYKKHISHFNLDEALEVHSLLNPKTTYLTHISHMFDTHENILKKLPRNVYPAYDGLKIEFK
ncbi:MAG: MBL fold metallo-hydrolase [Bacteroidales bacterium]|nr:MBL fold metallo-hydrolase [Bacteroidales bacterium]